MNGKIEYDTAVCTPRDRQQVIVRPTNQLRGRTQGYCLGVKVGERSQKVILFQSEDGTFVIESCPRAREDCLCNRNQAK